MNCRESVSHRICVINLQLLNELTHIAVFLSLALLELAYSLIWCAQKIWGQRGGTFMISGLILQGSEW